MYYRILESPPTAELEPLDNGQIAQTDEVSINMSTISIISMLVI